MTQAEEKKINELYTLLRTIKEENNKFKEDTTLLVKVLNDKLDKKFLPISLEENILQSAQVAVGKAIAESLTGYNSPMTKLVSNVINKYETQLTEIVESCFTQIISTDDFRKSIYQGLSHKIGRNIVNGSEGAMDKITNDLKSNPQFRAKATLAITQVINDFLENKQS